MFAVSEISFKLLLIYIRVNINIEIGVHIYLIIVLIIIFRNPFFTYDKSKDRSRIN